MATKRKVILLHLLIIALVLCNFSCSTPAKIIDTSYTVSKVTWESMDESSIKSYILQYSVNSIDWIDISSIPNIRSGKYVIDNITQLQGYFRLKIIRIDDEIEYGPYTKIPER